MKLTCPLGYSRKNPNRWGIWWIYFSEKPLEFLDLSLYLQKLWRKQAFTPWKLEILQNCVPPLGNSNVKNQDPRKFHISFSLKPQKLHFFFNWTLGFLSVFSLEWKFHVFNPWPPYLDFFWNSQLLKMSNVKMQQKIQIWSMSMGNKGSENQYHSVSSLEFEGENRCQMHVFLFLF